jgi:hypothetical protein
MEDGSIVIAILQNGNSQTNWAEGDKHGLRVNPDAFNSQKYLQGNTQAFVGIHCNVLI